MDSSTMKAKERLEIVGELASLINTTFDLDEIFRTAILKIKRVLDFRRASVVLVSEHRKSFYLHTLFDAERGGFMKEEQRHYPVDQGLTGKVIRSGQAIRVDDFGGTSGIRVTSEKSVSALIVPLLVKHQVIGTLNLGAAESETYSDEDLELAVLLGRQIETSLYYSNMLATIQQQREALSEEHSRVQKERSQLEALIEASDAAILMERNGQVAHANQTMADLLVLPREVVVGASMEMVDRVLTRALARPSDLAAQAAALTRGDTHLSDRVELEFPRKLVCQRTVAPVVSAAGEVLGHLVMYRDVTKEAEAEAAKSEFVSIVSHELRTPLTSIKTSLGLLRKGAAGALSKKMGELLEIALRNLDRLIRLVDDLLDLSRIESGRMLGKLNPIRLDDSVQMAVEAVRDYAQDRQVSIDWTPPDDDVSVVADSDRLQQVIVNLLSNGIKFSPAGASVSIDCQIEPRSAVLVIADQGPGIPDDQLTAIFDKFRQLELASTRKHSGAGLGLAISRTIVEQFGGELWAESEIGKGSKFSVRLRLSESSAEAEAADLPSARKVLIVEKDPAARQVWSDRLNSNSWATRAVSSGAEGLDVARTWRPEVLVVGVELEDMHGLEFLQRLRADPKTVDSPALMVGDSGDAGQAVAYGADSWISRDPDGLEVEVKRLATSPRRPVVLLIEDDPAVRVGLSRGLRRAGYACLEASSGEAGLQLARIRPPAVVVTDWRVPGKDGLTLLAEMRGEPALAEVPAIVVTGYADNRAADEVGALNAELMQKPFSPSHIVREIDRLLEKSSH